MLVKPRKLYYSKLRELLRKRGHTQSAIALSAITGRSSSYMARCLSGQRSFQPDDMTKIMDYLGIEKKEAIVYFPPFGIQNIDYLSDEQEEVVVVKKEQTLQDAIDILCNLQAADHRF